MKNNMAGPTWNTLLSLLVFLIVSGNINAQVDTIFNSYQEISGNYFSSSKPGESPEVFAPYLLNSSIHHLHSAPVFSLDGNEMYFSAYVNNEHPQRIFSVKRKDGIWQKPEIAAFSGKYQDGGPVLSPDGNTLYYYSKHPDLEGEAEIAKSRIRYVIRENGNWSKPMVLEIPELSAISYYPSHFSTDGIYYFFAEVKERDYDIFRCRIVDYKAVDVERIDEPISQIGSIESGAITDPDNKILIFSTFGRIADKKAALYYCLKQIDNTWSEPILFEEPGYLAESRFTGFTPCGQYFFYLSYKEGYEQIYWVSSKIIYDLITF
jgi:Tol biopolymer transport system component